MASDILDPSVINFHGDFYTQVENIMQRVRLTRSEVEDLRRLFFDLEQTLREYWPGCIVMPFGSIVTGLGIKSSDADCYVHLPEHLKSPNECYVMTAKQVLKRRPHIFQNLFVISAAKVPIVKFFHTPTQCEVDINFTSPAGVQNSKLIAYLLHIDRRALHLAVLLKYWSKVHQLTGVNLVPNYALTMMIIFFLQQMSILPPVCKLQQGTKQDIVENWNTSFNESYQHHTSNDMSLYALLGGFFEYFSTYQYKEYVISPYTGYSIDRNQFKRLDFVPDEFDLYKENIEYQKCKPLQINNPMCVQDPFEHSRNSSVAVYPRLLTKLVYYLKHAADNYKNCSQNHFLKTLLDPRNVPDIPVMLTTRREQNRLDPKRPNRVTKEKYRNKGRRINLNACYGEASKLQKNFHRRRF
ncbi:terminal uridylyltransferase Tailor isoform X1 [Amyelois transitella]|uniref:terminal uridylyltransferase Tailor isoform X1 n=2 Tax=Amyelois transitella TaxID=680683 RepID=UPI00298FD769|nr:terminal uridylyltransferase Tailor isoform X1 [Amyelois transitella]